MISYTSLMTTLKPRLQLSVGSKWLRRAMWGIIPLLGAVSFYAISQATPPKSIELSAEPLYARGSGAKPTISLALSVEFPTVGAQFLDNYTVTEEYLGYFDFNSCYTYNNNADASLRRFDRTGPATARECGGSGFSGNFMNWATGSAIDVLRLGLTGGDRIKDEESLTILQRAVIRNSFFNSSGNFPSKNLPTSLVDGAVPSSLKGTFTGDIKVANCLNRVHFGTTVTGSCDAPGANSNLGVATAATGLPPTGTTFVNGGLSSLPNNFSGSSCANENGTCTFSGSKYVAYGAGTTWSVGVFTNGTACTNGVFRDPINGTAKKCYIGDNWVAPPSTATVLSSDNFFYTRVQVCEPTDPRTVTVDGFCLKQPSGKYKPVGNLQKYSDRVRIAAFGYLKDDTLARYGGVLRAPMKFLGPNTYDQSGALQAGVNPNVEWDVITGVFKTNPEGASEGISGVVNYLNQFGRTSATSQGEYKTYDPVGELYYEALRYVQGLQPTPQAVSNITTTMKDGFPVYSTWTDPHAGGSTTSNYSCLKNNIVVVGDKNTHADKSLPGNSSTTSSDFDRTGLNPNEVNFRTWTNIVGGFEAKSSVSYTDAAGTSRNTNNPANTNAPNTDPHYPNLADALPYTCCNNNSYLMAGAAYWANTQDIRFADDATKRPGMRAKTYVIDVNENGGSTSPAARKNNQFLLAAKYGGFTDKSKIGNPFLKITATDTTTGQPTAFALDNSGWQKSVDNGDATGATPATYDPKNYFLASSAKAVLAGLNEIFESIASEGNSIANGSISTTSFAQGGFIYNAKFDPTDWSGDVISTPVSAPSGVVNIAVNTPQWKAATVMNANTPAYFASTRKIIAGRSQGNIDGSAAGVAFDWSSVSGDNGTLKDALDKPTPAAATGDGLSEARLNYLRGVKTNEGSPFRSRSSLLGDIVNSPVVYSKPFAENVNTTEYKTFMASNSSRPGALFVGANDGMFHAFNADTGAEIFAYIPSWLASKLPALTDPTYNSTKHQSYVDGPTDIAEALVNSNWKTVLLSSTGGGGQGVFALDVSNPTAFDATKVMWEFTDRDDADLGNVMGTPKVVKIQINSKSDAIPLYKWYAVVPSGVNNFVADSYVSTSKKPHLFLLSLDKTAGTAWAQGTNYYKFEIPTLDTLSATVSPGAINFQATTGLAGELDVLYMGDLHGNLWKFDFDTATSPSGKTLSNVTFTELTAGNSNKPLFVAKDSAGNVQPIAITPKLVNGPDNGIIVMFGTGKYLETSDNNLTPVRTQSVYAINDIEVGSSRPKFVAGRDYLQRGTSAGGIITIDEFIWGRVTAANIATSKERSGWYFDYAASGERSVSDFTTSGLNVYFGTVVPPQNLTDPCSGGSGNIYAVNFTTGGGTSFVSQVGLIGQIFIQKTTTSLISDSNSTGTRTETTTERIVIKGTEGFQTPPDDIKTVSQMGRLAWRQINNYHELKNRP
jgi:type IV pilus assembly protein PilY1